MTLAIAVAWAALGLRNCATGRLGLAAFQFATAAAVAAVAIASGRLPGAGSRPAIAAHASLLLSWIGLICTVEGFGASRESASFLLALGPSVAAVFSGRRGLLAHSALGAAGLVWLHRGGPPSEIDSSAAGAPDVLVGEIVFAALSMAIALTWRRSRANLAARLGATEELVAGNQQFLRKVEAALDHAGDCILIGSAVTLRVEYANRAAVAQLGYTMEDLRRLHLHQLSLEFDEAEYRRVLEPLLSGRVDGLRFETTQRHRDGHEIPVEMSLRAFREPGDAVGSLIAVARDISGRRREESLRDDIVENMSDLVQSVAPDGTLQLVNRAWRQTLGYSDADIAGLNVFALIHPGEKDHCQAIFGRLMGGEPVGLVQTAFVAKDGRRVDVEGSLNVRYENGEAVSTRGIFRDISHRGLLANAEFQREILAHAGAGIIATTVDGVITLFNPEAERLTGWSEQEVVGKLSAGVFHDPGEMEGRARELSAELGEAVVPGVEALVAKARRGEVETREWTYVNRDGSRVPVLLSVSALRDAGGSPTGFLAVARDISEVRSAEARDRRNLKIMELAEQQAGLASFTITPGGAGRTVWWSQGLFRLFGFDPASAPDGQAPPPDETLEHVHPEDRAFVAAAIEVMHRGESPGEIPPFRTNPARCAERVLATRVEIDGTMVPVRRTIGTVLDVTESSRRETELRGLSERLGAQAAFQRAILEQAGAAIIAMATDGTVTLWNPEAERLTGRAAGTMVGESSAIGKIFDPGEMAERSRSLSAELGEAVAPGFAALAAGARSGRPGADEWTWVGADGHRVPVLLSATPLVNGGGDVTGLLVVARDIGELKRAERALGVQVERQRETNRELKRSNADLQQFAYVASHDLQEPLRAVSSCVQLLEERLQGRMDEASRELARHAVEGASRMQALIEDLLAYSRIGSRAEEMRPVDCEQAVGRALANLSAAIDESGARVTHDPLPVVSADEGQVVMLLQNLISNAIKFRGDDPPRVHLGVGPDRAGGMREIVVEDNGIGIEAVYRDRIFTMFQRLHGRDRYPGTGMGLAICRRIVERHGGRIWVESTPGRGSTFHVTLPAEEEARHAVH